jgi:hypothetical protein
VLLPWPSRDVEHDPVRECLRCLGNPRQRQPLYYRVHRVVGRREFDDRSRREVDQIDSAEGIEQVERNLAERLHGHRGLEGDHTTGREADRLGGDVHLLSVVEHRHAVVEPGERAHRHPEPPVSRAHHGIPVAVLMHGAGRVPHFHEFPALRVKDAGSEVVINAHLAGRLGG